MYSRIETLFNLQLKNEFCELIQRMKNNDNYHSLTTVEFSEMVTTYALCYNNKLINVSADRHNHRDIIKRINLRSNPVRVGIYTRISREQYSEIVRNQMMNDELKMELLHYHVLNEDEQIDILNDIMVEFSLCYNPYLHSPERSFIDFIALTQNMIKAESLSDSIMIIHSRWGKELYDKYSI